MLGGCAAQTATVVDHMLDLQGNARRVTPEQQLGKIVQQRAGHHLVGIHVVPQGGEVAAKLAACTALLITRNAPSSASGCPASCVSSAVRSRISRKKLVSPVHHQRMLDGSNLRRLPAREPRLREA
jgi:hypothetical protein